MGHNMPPPVIPTLGGDFGGEGTTTKGVCLTKKIV
jgi:hypothetical protein